MPYIDPEREAFRQFASLSADGPINMLNLVRFHPRAQYADGDRGLSGAEAYAAYGAEIRPYLEAAEAKRVWAGVPFFPVIGPADEVWDTGFVVAYPSKDAFTSMVRQKGYQAAAVHRTAAVSDSRLYCFLSGDGPAGDIG